jgi:hypothetical protein
VLVVDAVVVGFRAAGLGYDDSVASNACGVQVGKHGRLDLVMLDCIIKRV